MHSDEAVEREWAILFGSKLQQQTKNMRHDVIFNFFNVLTYIAGYIVRKLQDKVCGAYKGKLVATIDPADPHHQLLAAKAHSGCVVGLSAPSCLLVGCVDLLEAHYRDVVDGFISGVLFMLLQCFGGWGKLALVL